MFQLLHAEKRQGTVRPKNDAKASGTAQLHHGTRRRSNEQFYTNMMHLLLAQFHCTIATHTEATGSSTKK
jgi:hypothetical protein